MDTKTKANIKRVLNVFWHLEPTSDIYMFHHVTMTPEVERSCCKLDTEDFVHFLDQKRDYVSLDALTDDSVTPGRPPLPLTTAWRTPSPSPIPFSASGRSPLRCSS